MDVSPGTQGGSAQTNGCRGCSGFTPKRGVTPGSMGTRMLGTWGHRRAWRQRVYWGVTGTKPEPQILCSGSLWKGQSPEGM